MKQILGIYSSARQRSIGDGLSARSLFSQRMLGCHVSPFLSLDHVVPMPVAISSERMSDTAQVSKACKRLTMVRQGQVSYADANGAVATLNAGDVHWSILPTACPTAVAAGQFSVAPTLQSDAIELWQLWVELPVPFVQFPAADLPVLALPDDAGSIRVLAGEALSGPCVMSASSPLDVWELVLRSRSAVELTSVDGRTLLLVVLHGTLQVNGDQTVRSGEVVMLDRSGNKLFLQTQTGSEVLLLSGMPLGATAQ